jgi:hypothetical protein
MYASRVMVDTHGRGNNVPVRLFVVLFIICRCARAGAGMFFTPDQCISVFGLAAPKLYLYSAFAIGKPTIYNLASSIQRNLSRWSASSNPVQKYLAPATLLRQTAAQGAKALNINA